MPEAINFQVKFELLISNSLSFEDLHFPDKEIDGNADAESPAHIRHGQGDTGDQERHEIFLVGLEASEERAQLQAGEHQKALQLFEELLPVIPDHTMLHHTIGNLHTKMGRKGVGHYYLGRHFWLEGDVKNARYHLHETLTNPTVEQPILAKAKDLLDDIERLEKDL